MTVFSDHVAALETTDRTAWLGEMVYFTIPDATVDHGLFAALLDRIGLDRHTPQIPKDENVFQRVFGNRQVREVATDDPDIAHRFLIRKVDEDTKEIVVEKVDAKGKRLSHDYALQVVFDETAPADLQINVLPNNLEPGTQKQAQDLAEEKAAEYRGQRGHITAYAVREIIRRTLDECRATIVRTGGGLYFVAAKHAETVTALKTLGSFQQGWEVRSIPCIDDHERREIIRQAYENESTRAVDELIDEVLDLVRAGEEISARRFASFVERQREVKAKMSDYEELLDDKMSATDTRITVLGTSMAKLLDKVKA